MKTRTSRALACLAWAGLGWMLQHGVLAQGAGISVSVEPRQFSTDDAARLTVTLSGESVTEPVLPSVDGLQFRPAGQSSQMRSINGVVSTSRSQTYLVLASEPGAYEIPPITARIDGVVRQSAPVSLRVERGMGLSRTPPAAPFGTRARPADTRAMSEEEGHRPAFLRIQPSKTESYVGELVPVQIKAYFREELQARLGGLPQLSGTAFTWHMPSGQPQQTREVVGNQPYAVLTWYAGMSATKPGDFPVTAQLEATLLVPDPTLSRGSPFDAFFGDDPFADFFGRLQERRVSLASEAQSFRVDPLPADGQPADFNGAVGRFELSASAKPVTLAPGDPVTVRAGLKGYGNFDRVSPPRLSEKGSFKTYDPTSHFEPRDTVGYQGVKTFEQVLIPTDSSVAEIPAFTFTYFDPDAGQYQTVRTAPIPLHISPAGGAAAPPDPKPHPASQAVVAKPDSTSSDGPELGPTIRHELGRLSRDLKPTLLQPWFMGLQVLPLLAIGWGLHLHRRNAQRRANPARLRSKQANRAVADALALMNTALRASDAPAFFAACRHAVQERLGERWGLPSPAITLADIRKRLPEALDLQRAFATADAVAYSGQTYTQEELRSFQQILQRELDALGGEA